MVGREAGSGDNGQDVPGLCGGSKDRGDRPTRTVLPECCYQILAQGAWATQDRASGRAPSKTRAKIEVHDAGRGIRVSLVRTKDATSRAVLHHWMVYRLAPGCDRRDKMVHD